MIKSLSCSLCHFSAPRVQQFSRSLSEPQGGTPAKATTHVRPRTAGRHRAARPGTPPRTRRQPGMWEESVVFAAEKKLALSVSLSVTELILTLCECLQQIAGTCSREPSPVRTAEGKRVSSHAAFFGLWTLEELFRGNGVICRTQRVIQGDDNGHVGRHC